MGFIVAALAPTFLLIALGYGLRRLRMVEDNFWPGAERLTYFVLFPALLFGSLARAQLDFATLLPMAVTLPLAAAATAAGLLLLRPAFRLGGPGFSSLFQGAIRPNTYVGLAIAQGVFGEPGVTLAAVGIAVVIPLVNVLSVLVLVRFGRLEGRAKPRPLRGVATNPLIIAVLLGAIANVAGLGEVPVVDPLLRILGDASLPIGLLAVGAGLDFAAVQRSSRAVALAVTIRLVVVPAVTAGIGLALGLTGLPLAVALLYNGLPTSASSYVLARLLGGDAPMLAGIITAATLAAVITIPVMLAVVL